MVQFATFVIQAAVEEKGYTLWGLVPFLKYQAEHPNKACKRSS
jgi:hypothetical protein